MEPPLDPGEHAVNPSGSHAHHRTSFLKVRVTNPNDVIHGKQQCGSFRAGDLESSLQSPT